MDSTNDTLIAGLTERVEAGVQKLHKAIETMRDQYAIIRDVQKDTEAYMSALKAASRGSSQPYTHTMLPTVDFSISNSDGFKELVDEHTPVQEIEPPAFELAAPKEKVARKKGKALDVSNDSLTGVLRNVLRQSRGAMTIDAMLDAIPTGLTINVDRDAIYRILPKMAKRKEIIPTRNRGEYIYNFEKFP